MEPTLSDLLSLLSLQSFMSLLGFFWRAGF
jgi:hypothetical protein